MTRRASRALRRAPVFAALALAFVTAPSPASVSAPQPCSGAETWTKVGEDIFRLQGLPRSQGVTSDGKGWIFSWQGGLERANDRNLPVAIGIWPPGLAVQPEIHADGTNHIGVTHVGDIDVHNGTVYAPLEDGGQDIGPITLNNPEYQHPYIALYDAKTLLFRRAYALPLELQEAGVPWVAVNGTAGEVYTDEWGMPHDRINVYDLNLKFTRFIDLHYPASLGTGFHLSRIQGAKVFGNALYASRDDDAKSVFKIDLATGDVTKLFSLNPGVPSELEGIAIRPTADGALLHLLIVLHNDSSQLQDFTHLGIGFEHFALSCS